MRRAHRRIAILLAAVLAFSSLPFTGRQAGAQVLQETDASVMITDPGLVASDIDLMDEAVNEHDGGTGLTEKGNEADSSPDYVEGNVIVCLKTGNSHAPGNGDEITNDRAAELSALLDSAQDLMDVTEAVKESEEYGNEEAGPIEDEIYNDESAQDEEYTLQLIHSDRYTTQQMIEMLKDDPDVLFAEPDYIYHLSDNEYENEENFIVPAEEISEISGCDNEEDIRSISPRETDEEAYEEVTRDRGEDKKTDLTGSQYAYLGGPGGMDVPYWNNESHRNAQDTVVAVMDSGVDYEHEDLKDVMWDEGLLYPELKKLGGGRYGYNAMKNDSKGNAYLSYDPMDDFDHGTHCAGSVGALWNGYGVSGTANGTRIMAVKASNEIGSFPSSATLKGFNYIKTAKEAGVNVVAVNNSWGGEACNANLYATRELALKNIICCFAAGNENTDNDYAYKTASNMRENEGVICINSNDDKGKKSSFSNFGVRSADVSAPGTGIMSTVPTGMGGPDPLTCAPVTDSEGLEAKDDYKGDSTYFSYESMNGAIGDFAEDDGQKVLKISNMKNLSRVLKLSANSLDKKPEYLALSARYDKDTELALYISVRTKDGKNHIINPSSYLSDYYSCSNVYRLPDDMDLEHPTFEIIAGFVSGEPSATDSLYINGVSFTNERSNYAYMDGTSMAAPAVTGEVAVVASRWPQDCAGRRAARVIASTVPRDELVNTSRTDGVANVRKALACDYAPVVNRARIDEDGLLNISGYFFGSVKGSVSINLRGADISGYTIVEWKGLGSDEWDDDGKNDEDIIKLDPGTNEIPSDEIKVTVRANDGKSGSRWLTVSGMDETSKNNIFYKRLPIPTPDDGKLYEDFESTYFCSGAALDGSIYYTGIKLSSEGESSYTWKYTLSADGITSGWIKPDKNPEVTIKSNICAYKGMLIYVDEEDSFIKMYSPKDNMIYDTGLAVPTFADTNRNGARIVNAGNELYLLLTLQPNDSCGKEKTELYRLDVNKKELLHLYMLKSVQNSSAVSAVKDDEGTVTIISLNKKDEANIEREKIIINEDLVTSDTVTIPLPSGCCFDKQALEGAPNQYGIVLTGPCDHTDNTDSFLYKPEDESIVKLDKQLAPDRPVRTIVTEYKGSTYFLGIDMYDQAGTVFATADNDEFRGESEHKEPLPYYGDDKTGGTGDLIGIIDFDVPDDGKVPIGKSINVTPKITEMDGRKITYTWFCRDATIAGVDQSGRVTGKLRGSTVIGAIGRDSSGKVYKGERKVTVYSPIKDIKLSCKKLTVKGGSKFDLKATLIPADELRKSVEWTVSVPDSYTGVIEKIYEESYSDISYAAFKTREVGEDVQVKVTVTATDGSNKTATCLVTITAPSPEPSEVKVPVKSAALSDTGTISLSEGMEHEISLVCVSPAESSGYSVEWKSSSDAVTVSGNIADDSRAVVRANKKGKAKITAVITNTAPGGKKTVTVKGLTVKVEPSAVSGNEIRIFNKKKDITGSLSGNRLEVRKSLSLKVSVYSDSIPVKAGKAKVLWSSSDPSVATVANGKVKAYKEGEVTFTATLVPTEAGQGAESVNASCTFYVYNPIRELKLNTGTVPGVREITAAVGDGDRPIAAVHTTAPVSKNDSVREDKKYEWTSSDPGVVEIGMGEGEENPAVVNLIFKKAGKAVITCKALDGSKRSVKCKVTVYERVSGIKITAKNLGTATVNTYNAKEITVRGLDIKKTFTISANLEPAAASCREVTYVSSNPEAVTVSNKGLVKRIGEGSADICVTTVDGGYTAVCHVTE